MIKYQLRLYIMERTIQSQRAIRNLREICESELKGAYEVEIIDVSKNPTLADNERILATPTLVRLLPKPVRKIIGDLSNRDNVLLGLDLAKLD